MVNYLTKDCKNPARNEELKKTLSVAQMILSLEKPITDHEFFNPLNPELIPVCYLLALLAHHFLHVSRIRVKSLTLRLLMSYIYIYTRCSPKVMHTFLL